MGLRQSNLVRHVANEAITYQVKICALETMESDSVAPVSKPAIDAAMLAVEPKLAPPTSRAPWARRMGMTNLDCNREGWLNVLFADFRWYRKWRGGKWELWWVDVVYCDSWHPVTEFSRIAGVRPTAICRGTPTEENWGDKDGGGDE